MAEVSAPLPADRTAGTPAPPADLPTTLGELRASEHPAKSPRGIRDELRDNLLTALHAGDNPWPGIVGFERTVLPQFERAILAGHDVCLLYTSDAADE